jgi:quinol monooxygenase YgiN
MANNKYILLVEAEVLPQYREEVADAAQACLIRTRAEESVEGFYQTAHADDPNLLVFLEVFASQEAHEVHMQQEYTKTFFSALEGKLATKPKFTRLAEL